MRKCEARIVRGILDAEDVRTENTELYVHAGAYRTADVYLYRSRIASVTYGRDGAVDTLSVTLAGWSTRTTWSRLRALAAGLGFVLPEKDMKDNPKVMFTATRREHE